MNEKLKLFLTWKGLDITEERFSYLYEVTVYDISNLFIWDEQIEGNDFWLDLDFKYTKLNLIKNNKLNRKLYPNNPVFHDYIMLEKK